MGYLSRIARQSGLRFSGQGGGSRGAGAKRAGLPPAPLDREEIVMIPPVKKAGNSISLTDPGLNEPSAPAERRPERPETMEPVNTPKPVRSPIGDDKQTPADAVRKEVRPIPPHSLERAENAAVEEPVLPLLRAEKTAEAGEAGEQTGIRTIKETLLVDGEREPGADKVILKDEPAPAERDAAPAMPDEKNYFAGTAEIIEGHDAAPGEVQTILLREIQEWVAAGRVVPEDGDAEQAENIEVEDVVRTAETTPGVVRIVGERLAAKRVADRPEVNTRSDIEEQRFDLSIGTISVIIEDAEKPAQPIPPAQTANNQNTSRETKREFSRLSRSYL